MQQRQGKAPPPTCRRPGEVQGGNIVDREDSAISVAVRPTGALAGCGRARGLHGDRCVV